MQYADTTQTEPTAVPTSRPGQKRALRRYLQATARSEKARRALEAAQEARGTELRVLASLGLSERQVAALTGLSRRTVRGLTSWTLEELAQ